MPRRPKADTFENCVSSEIATNYRRLARDKRVTEVIETLKRRGMTERIIEILFRNIASIPRDWHSENEPWTQTLKRRSRLGKKLRSLANEIGSDRDLAGWCFQITDEHLNAPPEYRGGMRTLASLVEEAATSLEPYDEPLKRISGALILSPAKFDQLKRPARKVPLTSYALKAIFDLLKAFIPPAAGKRPEHRALNKETEILASVLLKEQITPGTVTQLRKKTRRRNARGQ